MVSSNHSNSGENQAEEKKQKVKKRHHSNDSDIDNDNKKSKRNEQLTTNERRIPRSTRKEIKYDEDKSDDDISSDSGSDKDYYAAKDRIQDETEDDDVSDMGSIPEPGLSTMQTYLFFQILIFDL
jgi:hypothetical protein